jgi:hypothetical protein
MRYIYRTWEAEAGWVLYEYGGMMPRPVLQRLSTIRFFDAPAEVLKGIGESFSLEILGEESRLARHFWNLAKPYNALEKLDYDLITLVAGSRMEILSKSFNYPGGNKALSKRFVKLQKGLNRHLLEQLDESKQVRKGLDILVRELRLFVHEVQEGASRLGPGSKQPLLDVLKLYDQLEAELMTNELFS